MNIMGTNLKWIVIAVVVAVSVWFIWRDNGENLISPEESAVENGNTGDDNVANDSGGSKINVSKSAIVFSGTAEDTEKYSQLIKEYNGWRIQFDIRCQASPTNITVKNNTKVMFDNRSGDPRTITIGGVKYNFPGYGYKVLNISGDKNALPAKVTYNCGSALNTGSILIQK